MNRTKENGPARRDGMTGEKNAPEAENRAAPIGPEEVREAVREFLREAGARLGDPEGLLGGL